MSDFHNFGATLWITFLYQLCFFLIAYSFEFDYVTDFAGGTNFILLALYTRFYNDYANESVIQNFATFFVCLWGARLSGFLLYRVIVLNEDKRFENIRGSFVKFGAFWLMQMLWVWIVSLPVTYLNSSEFTVTETAFNAGNVPSSTVGCLCTIIDL